MSKKSREILIDGDGKHFPKAGDDVTMEYVGKLTNGFIFDDTSKRGPFTTKIGVGKVIKGWDEFVPQMSLGEKAILTIPGDLAYGERGFPNLIPPHSTLIFEVQLLMINGKDKAAFAKEEKDQAPAAPTAK